MAASSTGLTSVDVYAILRRFLGRAKHYAASTRASAAKSDILKMYEKYKSIPHGNVAERLAFLQSYADKYEQGAIVKLSQPHVSVSSMPAAAVKRMSDSALELPRASTMPKKFQVVEMHSESVPLQQSAKDDVVHDDQGDAFC